MSEFGRLLCIEDECFRLGRAEGEGLGLAEGAAEGKVLGNTEGSKLGAEIGWMHGTVQFWNEWLRTRPAHASARAQGTLRVLAGELEALRAALCRAADPDCHNPDLGDDFFAALEGCRARCVVMCSQLGIENPFHHRPSSALDF
eukprot:gnl/Spiro4/23264_TR11496_c0_g1_i1.p1 gnl/Spiro4/23264_TR11496_c0_g1~~gnl/Spiro4/23264_TR11496_c0_g1_i1.p1  ORF type:complete len:166 (+),score=39.92 gnl/Spiro4/23264_TR11496_c0_g1_i1:69-500(+)